MLAHGISLPSLAVSLLCSEIPSEFLAAVARLATRLVVSLVHLPYNLAESFGWLSSVLV